MEEKAMMRLMAKLRSPASDWDTTQILDKSPTTVGAGMPGAPGAPNTGALGAFSQAKPELNPANPVGDSGPGLPSQAGMPESTSTLDDLLKRHATSRKSKVGGLDASTL